MVLKLTCRTATPRSRAALAGAALLAFTALVSGCAPKPTSPDELADYQERNDPLEPTNRKLFAVNQTLDRAGQHPEARGVKAA